MSKKKRQRREQRRQDQGRRYANWVEALQHSGVFLALVTPEYFKDVYCEAQKEMALELGKPILILLKQGVEIPPDWFAGGDVIGVLEWSTEKELLDLGPQIGRYVRRVRRRRRK